MDTIVHADARLIILRGLYGDPNYSSSDSLLQQLLATYGINRTREWVRDEMRFLSELGAVLLTDAGTAKIATLTRKGVDHVERRITIEGVKRMSPAV